jgi:hypothetical protein
MLAYVKSMTIIDWFIVMVTLKCTIILIKYI